MPLKSKASLWWIALALVLLPHLLFLSYRLSEPVGGYQSTLESTNLLVARQFEQRSFLNPSLDGKAPYFETPVLYPYLISLLSRITGNPAAAGRILSITAYAGSTLLLFLAGTSLTSLPVSFAAAALYASLPISLMISRNIQADGLMICFLLLAFLFFQKRKSGSAVSVFSKWVPPIAFAVACLCSYTAWVAGAGWAVYRILRFRGSDGWRNKTVRGDLALGIGIPALVYFLWALPGPGSWADSFLAAFQMKNPFLLFQSLSLPLEAFWAWSPLGFLLLVSGILLHLRLGEGQDTPLRWISGAFLLLFLFFSKYSFYLVGLTPFTVLLAVPAWGKVLSSAFWKKAKWIIWGATLVLGSLVGCCLVVQSKYGFDEIYQIRRLLLAGGHASSSVFVQEPVFQTQVRTFQYYFDSESIFSIERVPVDSRNQLQTGKLGGCAWVFLYSEKDPFAIGTVIRRSTNLVVLFNRLVQLERKSPHFFRVDSWNISKGSNLPAFGLKIVEDPPMYGVRTYPVGTQIFKEGSKFLFKEK